MCQSKARRARRCAPCMQMRRKCTETHIFAASPLRPTTAPWVKAGREKEKVSRAGNRGSAFANVPFNFPLRRTWASGRRAAYVCLKAQMARLPSIPKAARRTLKVILFSLSLFFYDQRGNGFCLTRNFSASNGRLIIGVNESEASPHQQPRRIYLFHHIGCGARL